LIAPLALRPDDFILTLMTEFDVLKNADGVGSFANFVPPRRNLWALF